MRRNIQKMPLLENLAITTNGWTAQERDSFVHALDRKPNEKWLNVHMRVAE